MIELTVAPLAPLDLRWGRREGTARRDAHAVAVRAELVLRVHDLRMAAIQQGSLEAPAVAYRRISISPSPPHECMERRCETGIELAMRVATDHAGNQVRGDHARSVDLKTRAKQPALATIRPDRERQEWVGWSSDIHIVAAYGVGLRSRA